MAQEFFILKCCTCNFFQVHIVKKTKTWVCKMCNCKQSVIKVYRQGSAKECRLHVQKLNQISHEKRELLHEEESTIIDTSSNKTDIRLPYHIDEHNSYKFKPEQTYQEESSESSTGIRSKKSKWSAYIDEEDNSQQSHASKKVKWDFYSKKDNESKLLSCNVGQHLDSDKCTENKNKWNLHVELHESQSNLAAPTKTQTLSLQNVFKFPNSTGTKSQFTEMISCEDVKEKTSKNNRSPTNDRDNVLMKKTKNIVNECSSSSSSNSRVQVVGSLGFFSSGIEEDIDSILDL